jgi:hypothetical protein
MRRIMMVETVELLELLAKLMKWHIAFIVQIYKKIIITIKIVKTTPIIHDEVLKRWKVHLEMFLALFSSTKVLKKAEQTAPGENGFMSQ